MTEERKSEITGRRIVIRHLCDALDREISYLEQQRQKLYQEDGQLWKELQSETKKGT